MERISHLVEEIVRQSALEYIEGNKPVNKMKFERRRAKRINYAPPKPSDFHPVPVIDEDGSIDWDMEDRRV